MSLIALNAALADFERPRMRPLRVQEKAWRQTVKSTRKPFDGGYGCWRELGAPHQPKVLLLHGWGGDASLYAPLASALTVAGWHVVIPDLLGHGDSHPAPFGYAAQLRWLNLLQHHMGYFELVIAHSAGAVLAEAALASGVLHVGSRVLLAGPLTLTTLFQRFLHQTSHRLFSAQELAAAYLDAQGLSRSLLDPAHHLSAGKLLICHGARDQIIPPEEALKLVEYLPHAQLWRPADTGHMGLVQHAGLFPRIAHFLPLPAGKPSDVIND